jgi:phosphoglycolate phosphatase-like HAD superfamily hydrolase
MSVTDHEVSELRDALPVSVAVSLSDQQLRSGLDQARQLLGPGADTAAVQGAAWLLAHDPGRRQEQIDHMLQVAAMRREHLLQAEGQLAGAFRAAPDLDTEERNTTVEEILDELDRAEALLGVMTARSGGAATVTQQELSDSPPFAIEQHVDTLRVTTFTDGQELDVR